MYKRKIPKPMDSDTAILEDTHAYDHKIRLDN